MKDELITFETAVIAKEKGFDVPNKHGYIRVFIEGKYDCVTESCWLNNKEYFTLCPTQSLLQRWLRERYNIHVYATASHFINDPSKILYKYVVVGDSEYDDFESYEQALEAGLQEALKRIDNGKQ